MKHSIFTFVVLTLVLAITACQPAQKSENKIYTPEKTMPMELNNFETINLLLPVTTGGDALMATMQNRKTDREFLETNLSHKHLSEILWAANGVNRAENGKRTVPSAMAMYPLDTYAVLANGIYLYDPQKHELNPVIEGDYRELAGLQPFVKNAPLNLVFIANYNRYNGDRKIPEDKRLYLAALDAGHCTQNVYLYCASEGLKTVVRAGAQEKALLELLGLDENYQFVVAQTVGY
ncbi:SagB/ThcOx family dehydrogenase [Paludibacteraceae bacterium OttesenSCG-928-F17]|nr:SagB/ThcOx family dehydrogenase [Paludibacteraceae bacterium OttesenSCG-928-F17]